MKAASAIGIAVATVGILFAAIMEGTSPAAFFNVPAIILVMSGTAGATLAGVGMERMKLIPAMYKRAFNAEPFDMVGRVRRLVGFAEKARRDGLLALDGQLSELDDEFSRKGLQLVVDGTDPELVRDVLEAEIEAMSGRHASGAMPFEKAGGLAPTIGIIGTVMGLVHVLENLSQPATLGPAISGAFIATLLGVGMANVVFLPVAGRLKSLSAEEADLRWMTLEGILAIQAGDNPRMVEEKLMAFVAPELRNAEEAGGEAAAPAAAASEPGAEAEAA